ncbi:MAG: TraB/GumN family protein [Paracoccaceae bacterium]
MFRLLAAAFFCSVLAAAPADAACSGEDLRPTLTAGERAAVESALAGTPYREGNRWRATRGERVIDIVGTVHLDDPRLGPVAERLRPTVEAADTVLLEITPESEARLKDRMTRDPGMLLLPEGQTLPGLMDEEAWDLLADAVRARGMPPFMAARFQPWYLSLQLAIPPCAMPQIADGANGLDRRVSDMALEAGVALRPLEDPAAVFAMFGDDPLETQIDMLQASVLPPKVGEDGFATLVEGYFDERHAEAWDVSRVLARRHLPLPADEVDAMFETLRADLLDGRNRDWITTIEATPGNRLLLAFGAAHLFGEAGVLALLEAEGYRLERLEF